VALGPVQAAGAPLHHPCALGQPPPLDAQVLQCREERLAEGRQRSVVGGRVPAIKRNGTDSQGARARVRALHTPGA
jgi:hypothetical protein